jgi:hypothetical protein
MEGTAFDIRDVIYLVQVLEFDLERTVFNQ